MYVLQGFRCIFSKGLKRFILLPILFNILLFFSTFYLIYHYFMPYFHHYIAMLPSWMGFLSAVVFVAFLLAFFFLFFSMFTVLFSLAAAPFFGLLSEKAQNLFCHSNIPSLPLRDIAWRTIKRQTQFLGYFLPRFLAMLLLFFLPFIHPFYPFLWFCFATWILSMQYQDFVMDNNLVGFKEMRAKMQGRGLLSLGFGFIVNVLSFLPVINLLLMPAAVVGGTLLYCNEFHKKRVIIHQDGTTR